MDGKISKNLTKSFNKKRITNFLNVRDTTYTNDFIIAGFIGFDIIEVIKEGKTLNEICNELHIKKRPTLVLLTLLQAKGFVYKENGKYKPSKEAKMFFLKSSKYDFKSYYSDLAQRSYVKELIEVLKTDSHALMNYNGKKANWEELLSDEKFAKEFTNVMHVRGEFLADLVSEKMKLKNKKILDIGGGSGVYLQKLLEKNKNCSGAVLEKPLIANILEKKYEDNDLIEVIEADMFKDEFAKDFDVHFYSNVLHDWNEQENKFLIEKSFKCLPNGGMIVVHDAFFNDDGFTPINVAEYSVLLMFLTNGRCYGKKEIFNLMENAGFKNINHIKTIAGRGIIIGEKLDT